MKHDIKTTMHMLGVVLITCVLALLLAPYAVVEGVSLANENPFMVAGILIVSVAIGSFVMLKLSVKKNLVWLDAIMIFAFAQAIIIFTKMFFEWSGWIYALEFMAIYALMFWGLLRSMQKDKRNARWAAPIWNICMVFAFLGIGIKIGYLLPVWMTLTILVAAAIYDYWAVHKSKTMVKLAKFLMGRMLFPGFIFYKKQENNFAVLGGGDIAFMVLLGTALFKVSVLYAWLGMVGMFVGLVWLLYVSEEKKFYPAIPPIAAGLFIGILVAIALKYMGV